jgi:hypothetical protein
VKRGDVDEQTGLLGACRSEVGWIGRSQNKLEGVIFRYNPDKDTINRLKDVPENGLRDGVKRGDVDEQTGLLGACRSEVYLSMPGTGTWKRAGLAGHRISSRA